MDRTRHSTAAYRFRADEISADAKTGGRGQCTIAAVPVYPAIPPSARPCYTRAEIDKCAAGDTESNAGGVRLLGYRVGAPNAGLPASKNAWCEARFLRCKKSRRVETGKSPFNQRWTAQHSEPDLHLCGGQCRIFELLPFSAMCKSSPFGKFCVGPCNAPKSVFLYHALQADRRAPRKQRRR